jgi:23S rRNA (adenine2030-N6)-methyltransferase
MNYRHAYHAGNFADVLKHAVLARVIAHLKRKDTPFRVIDTHAGRGSYRLDQGAALKTGEWREGIGRIFGPDTAPLPPAMAELLEPYFTAIRAHNIGLRLQTYPGSPLLARTLMRPGDRLIANELHPEDHAALAKLFERDRQAKAMQLDGWTALKALLPPKERRGLVLIDPPFEQPGELVRLTEGLQAAIKRFSTGTYLLWYPIKDPKPVARFHRALLASGIDKLLKIELLVRPARNPEVLSGTGLVVANPTYGLEEEMRRLVPFLAERLAQAPGASAEVGWLASEAPPRPRAARSA